MGESAAPVANVVNVDADEGGRVCLDVIDAECLYDAALGIEIDM